MNRFRRRASAAAKRHKKSKGAIYLGTNYARRAIRLGTNDSSGVGIALIRPSVAKTLETGALFGFREMAERVEEGK